MKRGTAIWSFFAFVGLFIVFTPTLLGFLAVAWHAMRGAEGSISLEHYELAFSTPGFVNAIGIGLRAGLIATVFSVLISFLFFASFSDARTLKILQASLRPLLAIPHAAMAFGLLFLVAPSGFLVRAVAPILGLERPPDFLFVQDPWGLSLAAGLALKEIPFIAFMILAALPQVERRYLNVARALGHGRIWSWLCSVGPEVYQQVRLPIFAVLAFATSSVDMALILGPNAPPTLAVKILNWTNDPDLALRMAANAGAMVQLAATLLAIIFWLLLERLVSFAGRYLVRSGWRGLRLDLLVAPIGAVMGWSVISAILGIVLVGLWSLSGPWRFPDLLPQMLTLAAWMRQLSNIQLLLTNTLVIAICSALFSLILAIACLENEHRRDRKLGKFGWFAVYLPLILPQIVFVVGISQICLRLSIDGNIWAVTAAHVIFVFPYVYLTLASAWNRFDLRYLALACSMGKTETQALFSVRIPMLLTPILVAFALGFSVSLAQFLPTLLVGAGRVPTLTTEAIALGAGGNRRIIGVYAFLQALLPFFVFALASIVPNLLYRNRIFMQPNYQLAGNLK